MDFVLFGRLCEERLLLVVSANVWGAGLFNAVCNVKLLCVRSGRLQSVSCSREERKCYQNGAFYSIQRLSFTLVHSDCFLTHILHDPRPLDHGQKDARNVHFSMVAPTGKTPPT